MYKHALAQHKLYNSKVYSLEWAALNLNQILSSRQTTFMIRKTNIGKISLNILSNKLATLNGKNNLRYLNNQFNAFKVKMKKLFIIN